MSTPQSPTAGDLLRDPRVVLVTHAIVGHVQDAVRANGHIGYIDNRFADAGYRNVVVWGTPSQDGYIILVAGES